LNNENAKQLPALPPPIEPKAAVDERRPLGKPSANRKATAKRFVVLNSFVDESLSTLCRGDIAIWLILYRDTREGTARTAQSDLARRSGMSIRGAAKALKRLEKRGLMKVVYRGGLNRGASRYRVLPLPDT